MPCRLGVRAHPACLVSFETLEPRFAPIVWYVFVNEQYKSKISQQSNKFCIQCSISYSYTDIYRGQFAYHWQITLETPSNGYIQRIF